MFSIQQKLSLQSYLLWGILAGTAFTACVWLGFAPLTAWLMAGSLGLVEMSPYFGYAKELIASFGAIAALLLTFNVAVVAFVWLANLFTIVSDKRPETITDEFSTYRALNRTEPKERWLLNTIKQLSNQTGITIGTIFYRDVFSLFKQPNKYRQNKHSNEQQEKLVKKLIDLKNFYPPSLSAGSTAERSFVFIDSSVFDANKKITRKEIVATLAHELGHIANKDSFKKGLHQSLYWIAIILGVCSLSLWGIGLALTAHLTWYRLQQTKELMADAYSAQLTDPKDLISFFKKSAILEKKLMEKLSINKTYVNAWERWCSTHPEDKTRIKVLEQIQQEKSSSAKLKK
ncbi:M48 family metalloprotease [Candidatus Berkiella aquae]|uniref:Heat shock protein HtpX n=1 Tax=Candidatus Berkiella aquae TaxID=295108 RepID=A0A0Q9YP37_9GAMM|nr:M48 family metalloprotease [Candidatus Berkiella aquae]MCS5711617.1 M48 family metalloprotease [Candidatus Berkiella aquae]